MFQEERLQTVTTVGQALFVQGHRAHIEQGDPARSAMLDLVFVRRRRTRKQILPGYGAARVYRAANLIPHCRDFLPLIDEVRLLTRKRYGRL